MDAQDEQDGSKKAAFASVRSLRVLCVSVVNFFLLTSRKLRMMGRREPVRGVRVRIPIWLA